MTESTVEIINRAKAKKAITRPLINYDYELVDKRVRKCTDVTKLRKEITDAIKVMVPNARNIKVVEDGYSFDAEKIAAIDLRLLGKEISKNCPELSRKARVYLSSSSKNQHSRQIFKRRKKK